MTTIKIDSEEFEVPEKVRALFQKLTEDADMWKRQVDVHVAAVGRSGKMIDDCRRFLTAVIEGDRNAFKILRDGELQPWEAGRQLTEDWDREVRLGLTGWLQENWSQICSVSCRCGGGLINYDAVRATGKLICKKCFSLNNEPNAQGCDTSKAE